MGSKTTKTVKQKNKTRKEYNKENQKKNCELM